MSGSESVFLDASHLERVLDNFSYNLRCDMVERANEQPTLRDRLAMAALQGLLASETEESALGALEDVSRHNRFERAARFAYAHADAMLEARELPAVVEEPSP